ncbi:MAG TPA: pseudouridine synthase [Candidatus Nitrosocosmicus sp.]|nr:pseudouridine synthase [Candidatus Nitrosocosmicus sp.]
MKKATTIRLDSYLSGQGYASRRKIEEFLKENKVMINGQPGREPGFRINPLRDKILINGQPVYKPQLEYYILNKPKNVISTSLDEHSRRTVVSMVPSKERLFPVGRLDAESSGLILLTNDGDLANKLTHPKYHIPKTYEVLILGGIPETKLQKLRTGVRLRDGMTAPADVIIIKHIGDKTFLKITLYEGRNRQIRRMCGLLGLDLIDLKRISIGPIELGNLRPGQSRKLTKQEVDELKKV